jgi:hypothetical protein
MDPMLREWISTVVEIGSGTMMAEKKAKTALFSKTQLTHNRYIL